MYPCMYVGLCLMPTLLRDILAEAVSREPDLRLVPEPVKLPTIQSQLAASTIDTVVAVSSEAEGQRFATQLLREVPRLRIVIVGRDSRRTVLYQPPLEPTSLQDTSLSGFLDAIRCPAPLDPF